MGEKLLLNFRFMYWHLKIYTDYKIKISINKYHIGNLGQNGWFENYSVWNGNRFIKRGKDAT